MKMPEDKEPKTKGSPSDIFLRRFARLGSRLRRAAQVLTQTAEQLQEPEAKNKPLSLDRSGTGKSQQPAPQKSG